MYLNKWTPSGLLSAKSLQLEDQLWEAELIKRIVQPEAKEAVDGDLLQV